LRVSGQDHGGDDEGSGAGRGYRIAAQRALHCEEHPSHPARGDDDGMVTRRREKSRECEHDSREHRAEIRDAERAHQQPHPETGEHLV
jgi:hypothetical protein